jgi:hypothetical protein
MGSQPVEAVSARVTFPDGPVSACAVRGDYHGVRLITEVDGYRTNHFAGMSRF